MNKEQSFFLSFAIMILVAAAKDGFEWVLRISMPGDKQLFFMIGWYMLWKLFHDKNKD